jgi:hypothetical protein
MGSNVQEKRDDHRCLLALVVWMCLISFSSQHTTLFGESVLSRHTIPLDTSCENKKQQAIVSTHFPHIAPVKTVHAQT